MFSSSEPSFRLDGDPATAMIPRLFVALLFLASMLPSLPASIVMKGENGKEIVLDERSPVRVGSGEFSYKDDGRGPDFWGGIKTEWSTCSSGSRQSPIDVQVDTTQVPRTRRPEIDLRRSVVSFGTAPLNFYFNCETEFGECTELVYNETTYDAGQVHGHVPSEHHLNGVPYPLELHFVHESKNNDSLAFSVIFELGDEPNPWLQILIDTAMGMRKKTTIDLSKFLEEDSTLCTYDGSLTTPGCTEEERWILSTKPLKASWTQIMTYRSMLGSMDNNRPLQPLNGRTASCWPNKVSFEPPPVPVQPPVAPILAPIISPPHRRKNRRRFRRRRPCCPCSYHPYNLLRFARRRSCRRCRCPKHIW